VLENQKPTYTKFEKAYESHFIKISLEVTKLGQIIQLQSLDSPLKIQWELAWHRIQIKVTFILDNS